ncbi:MAG TPA: imidazole glycerol phosphate synthase subunit HisH [Mycobacteriales bacterium]|nr:imidazole glycerol phosphate synthase subunit HisH [Mycobacteriales bacterium]
MTAPSVVILDYGSGNLRSAQRALAKVGADVRMVTVAADAGDCDGVVVPGVGAFAACMSGVRDSGADELVRNRVASDRPVLGICVGMQVMYDAGDEHGVHTEGVGVLPGRVERLDADVLPHMGWNVVTPPAGSTLFAGVEGERFYFVHSYGVLSKADDQPSGATLATHGRSTFVAAIEQGPLAATQFHPEKSGDAGLHLLENWVRSLG